MTTRPDWQQPIEYGGGFIYTAKHPHFRIADVAIGPDMDETGHFIVLAWNSALALCDTLDEITEKDSANDTG